MLNPEIDYTAFIRDFSESCVEGVKRLAAECNSQTFYGICVYCDGFDGSFILYANSEEAFAKRLAYYQEKDSHYDEEDIHELKLNPGDWSYYSMSFTPDGDGGTQLNVVEEQMEPWSKLVHRLSYDDDTLSFDDYKRFEEAACEVAVTLEGSEALASLNKTSDFHIQVSKHDEPLEETMGRLPFWKAHGTLTGFGEWSEGSTTE